MADAAELRELEDDELEGRLSDYRRELLNLRFQLATGQLDNAGRLGQVRKDVARVLTILRDREIATAEGRDAGPVLRPVRPARPARPEPEEIEEIEDTEDAELAAEEEAPRPARRRSRAKAEVPVDDEAGAEDTTEAVAEDEAAGDADEEDE